MSKIFSHHIKTLLLFAAVKSMNIWVYILIFAEILKIVAAMRNMSSLEDATSFLESRSGKKYDQHMAPGASVLRLGRRARLWLF